MVCACCHKSGGFSSSISGSFWVWLLGNESRSPCSELLIPHEVGVSLHWSGGHRVIQSLHGIQGHRRSESLVVPNRITPFGPIRIHGMCDQLEKAAASWCGNTLADAWLQLPLRRTWALWSRNIHAFPLMISFFGWANVITRTIYLCQTKTIIV
jgi:hypothetical protein